MLRTALFLSILAAASPAIGATVVKPTVDNSRCAQDLASVDRSFAAAMADLHRNSAPANRCSAWRRQIDVMQKASAVFARCTPQKARAGAMSQMQGSIDDFRAMIAQAQCP